MILFYMLPGCIVGDNMINAKQVFLLSRGVEQFGDMSINAISAIDSSMPQHGIRFLIPKDARMDGLE